jgi:hypothetical protein
MFPAALISPSKDGHLTAAKISGRSVGTPPAAHPARHQSEAVRLGAQLLVKQGAKNRNSWPPPRAQKGNQQIKQKARHTRTKHARQKLLRLKKPKSP